MLGKSMTMKNRRKKNQKKASVNPEKQGNGAVINRDNIRHHIVREWAFLEGLLVSILFFQENFAGLFGNLFFFFL